jgi:secreted PhoX family phosphatase
MSVRGLNATADFSSPDNLALDKAGNLYITEDPSTPPGADIWVATPSKGGQHQAAGSTVRFASLPDCAAEPSGIYFDKRGWALFVHVQHRGGPDPRDLAVRIERVE